MPQNDPGSNLPADAAERLHALWQEIFAGAFTPPSSARLGSAAETVGSAARRAGLLPEHLVIGVKETWSHHAGRALTSRFDAERVLAEVMSLCIREYFRAPDHQSPAASDGDPGA